MKYCTIKDNTNVIFLNRMIATKTQKKTPKKENGNQSKLNILKNLGTFGKNFPKHITRTLLRKENFIKQLWNQTRQFC